LFVLVSEAGGVGGVEVKFVSFIGISW